jgi:gamma-glutamyl-gamma-aminobutyrate hydrolase PuuD
MDNNKPMLYVPDAEYYGEPFANMFNVVGTTKPYDTEVAKIADVVMLTGGSDIDPTYYNQSKHPTTSGTYYRDQMEYRLIQTCLEKGIPILGICRGAEWLAITAGGELFQHVSSHNTPHAVSWGKLKIKVHTSSLHHQMCDIREIKDAHVLAWADGLSNFYEKAVQGVSVVQPKSLKEPEVFILPSIKGFAVQGHPEMLDFDCTFNCLVRTSLAEFLKIKPDDADLEKVNNLINIDKTL